jgi:REP-associated tyrosine transposase
MPRSARLDTPGTLHHVIIRGIERRRIVDDDHDRHAFVDRMGDLSGKLETPVCAWALMTNHAHILLRSGPAGLSAFMRKLLTGYAVNYNRRHHRHGHLFQNRYKSIVCEEDTYFMELVRYIHLNPLRAGLVDTLPKLDWYRWCGHAFVLGRRRHSWYARNDVLRWFGKTEKESARIYRDFVKNGIELGSQPHLVGGGLIRSAGGWFEVKALRRIGDRQASDELILGGGAFVKRVTREMEMTKKYRLLASDRLSTATDLIADICKKKSISVIALQTGSRLRSVSKVRAELACLLVNEQGLSFAETARQLGVSTSAIAGCIDRHVIMKSTNKPIS